jgi:hypothetical protein
MEAPNTGLPSSRDLLPHRRRDVADGRAAGCGAKDDRSGSASRRQLPSLSLQNCSGWTTGSSCGCVWGRSGRWPAGLINREAFCHRASPPPSMPSLPQSFALSIQCPSGGVDVSSVGFRGEGWIRYGDCWSHGGRRGYNQCGPRQRGAAAVAGDGSCGWCGWSRGNHHG